MSKKIILFADNDLDFLNTRTEFLEAEGYEVLQAPTLADAERSLRKAYSHLAILDIRLVNDDDEKDTSGLALAQEESNRNIPKIILTGYGGTDTARSVLRQRSSGFTPAIDYLEKEEGPEALLSSVHRAFIQHVRINWELEIDWRTLNRFSLVHLIEPESGDEHLLNRADELEDLFRRLFYENHRIRIDHLLWQDKFQVALTVFAFKANAAPEGYVVVCGPRQIILEEADRYKEFSPQAPGESSTVLKISTEITHFAANAYALAGADLESTKSLLELFRSSPEKIFNASLNNLFQKTLADWYQEKRIIVKDKSLSDFYRQNFKLNEVQITREDFSRSIREVVQQTSVLGQGLKLYPEKIILSYSQKDNIFPDPSQIIYRDFALGQPIVLINSPGYISGKNLITALDGHVWLTDFGDAGYCPLLWNYVMLESEIRFDWLETRDLHQLFSVERALVAGDFYQPDLSDIEPSLRKVIRAIRTIRKLTYRDVGKHQQDYHLGIFFCAAKRIADYNSSSPILPNELARLAHALMAMAMIGESLLQEEGQSTIHSDKTPGITIDKANHQVIVEGRPVNVSPQDFDLLVYLYDRPNQLCKREDVFTHVYGREYSESEDYLLYTAISRLREKIETDKEHPQFLLTKRGVGYTLKFPTNE